MIKNNADLFKSLLLQAEEETTKLSIILKDELEIITSQNFDSLASILADKLKIADNIEKLEKQRSSILSKTGYSTDNDGTTQFINECDNSAELQALWQKLINSIKHCQMMNQANKMVVDKNQKQIRRVLEVLTGQGSNQPNETYSRTGNKTSSFTGNEISKA